MKEHKTVCCGDPCTCEEKTAYTVEVPSEDVAENLRLAINVMIHDAWQEGYEQGKTDATNRWRQDLQEALDEQAAINRGNREAGIQHDGDFPDHCPLYCTKHNHEEMGG